MQIASWPSPNSYEVQQTEPPVIPFQPSLDYQPSSPQYTSNGWPPRYHQPVHDRPSSRQQPHDRAHSRQQTYGERSSGQQTFDRPYSRQDPRERPYSHPQMYGHTRSHPDQHERLPHDRAPSRQQPRERAPSRQQPQLRPPSRQQPQERPPSRQHHQDGCDRSFSHAPSRQQPQERPPSRQQPQERPPSRQHHQEGCDRPLSRQQPNQPRPHRYSERNDGAQSASDAARRTVLKGIADSTIAAINRGMAGVEVNNTQRFTKLFYDDDRDLSNWNSRSRSIFGGGARKNTEINFVPLSTLKGARYLHEPDPRKKIGVLNFASATQPGGGFLSGARAQEESIARSSTLYVSLTTKAARPFYAMHDADNKKGFYTHSMIYSPDVYLFRDDDGAFLPPIKVDVLTSPAVNAGLVRRHSRRTPAQIEAQIQEVMRERMGRILALFEKKKARCLVLGSFGTGVFQNDVRAMAGIWYDLLHAPGARFACSFDHVIFAIPDDSTRKQFGAGFMSGAPRTD